jgi:hypothetical protein
LATRAGLGRISRSSGIVRFVQGGVAKTFRWADYLLPNCDFYAFGDDHRLILAHIFDTMPCRVYELASGFDAELAEFRCLSELEDHYGISNWADGVHETILLQLHPNDAGGKVELQRVDLDPSKCDGATYRFQSRGWGLIQLYLFSPIKNRKNSLNNSHTNHNSQKRSMKWAPEYSGDASPAAWNWSAVTSFSNKLNRFIRKSSVAKNGSRVILPCAQEYLSRV